MIKIKDLFLRYTREFYALYDINIEIADGESVAFVGADESGKTSLLRILTKLEKKTKGEVFVRDIPIEKLNYKTDISAGYVPSTPVFYEKKSVYENFKYILKAWGLSEKEIENKINSTIIEYSLEKLKDTKVKDLSLDEKYILSLIRLSLRPLDLLIVDDIFSKLSSPAEEVAFSLIKNLVGKKTTLVVATANEEVANKLCKRKIYFKYGSIVDKL